MNKLTCYNIRNIALKMRDNLDQLTVLQATRILNYVNIKYNGILRIRYSANPGLCFQSNEIESIAMCEQEQFITLTLSLNIFSIIGASGLLPSHYTLDILAAKKSKNIAALEFINMFHDMLAKKYVTMLMKYHPSINLTSVNYKKIMQLMLGSHSNNELISDIPLLANSCVSKQSLQKYLVKHTKLKILISSVTPYSQKISSKQSFSFNDEMALGQNTLLGSAVRMDASHFTLNIIAENNQRCIELYNDDYIKKKIIYLIQSCLGYGYRFSFNFLVSEGNNQCCLDGNRLLGVNCNF